MSVKSEKFIEAVAKDDNLPINLKEMTSILQDVSKLAGNAVRQSRDVHKKISYILKKKRIEKIQYQLK